MGGDEDQWMKSTEMADGPDHEDGPDQEFLTIAYIYTEDTPMGFFVQVFQRHLGVPKALRLVDAPVLEGSMEFMTVEPAEVFVTLGIKKIGANIDISLESLAFRSRGYDHVEVSVSRHSSAKRLFHIIFNPLTEVIRIRVYELSVTTSPPMPESFPAEFEVYSKTSAAQTSSNSGSTAGDHEKLKPRGNEAVGQVQTGTVCSAVTDSCAETFLSFAADNIAAGWERFGEDDGPVDVTHADTKIKQGKVSNLIRRKKVETSCSTSSDERADERLPLLRPASRGVLCKKKIEIAVSRAQGYVGSFLRKADPTGRFQK